MTDLIRNFAYSARQDYLTNALETLTEMRKKRNNSSSREEAEELLRETSEQSEGSASSTEMGTTDGCSAHGVDPERVAARWTRIEQIITATPEDDHSAQWSVLSVCPCCGAPARVESLVCTSCTSADLDALATPPPCALCSAPGYAYETEWRCADHVDTRRQREVA